MCRIGLAVFVVGGEAGRYQILAAISAVDTSARDVSATDWTQVDVSATDWTQVDVSATDWTQVVALYDQLVRLDRSPTVALNRAIAVAELDGSGLR